MSDMPGQDHLSTHDVTNQPAPRGDLDLWAEDPALGDHAVAAGADSARLGDFGALIGSARCSGRRRSSRCTRNGRRTGSSS